MAAAYGQVVRRAVRLEPRLRLGCSDLRESLPGVVEQDPAGAFDQVVGVREAVHDMLLMVRKPGIAVHGASVARGSPCAFCSGSACRTQGGVSGPHH
jgi:hypothetical protein